jgi:hypothetical protein
MDWISFWSSSKFWERSEYIAEAIVIVGAVVEVLTDFKHILKGDEKRDLRERVGKYAAIVLIFGLALELLALARTNQLFDITIASLTTEARDANKRATEAQDRAATAETRTAEVEESVAPRRLTASQREFLKSNLSRFAGQEFGAWHDTFDLESSVFARELVSTLNDNARWRAKPNFNVGGSVSMFTAAPVIPDTGILISATRDDASQRASDALIQDLRNNGFDCSRGEEFVKGTTGPVTEPFIYIHVLARPEGPQGEAKVRAQQANKSP